jgi:hypothetical protein
MNWNLKQSAELNNMFSSYRAFSVFNFTYLAMGITQGSSSRFLRHTTAFPKSFDVFPKLLIEAICHEGTSPPLKTDTSIILQK